MRKAHEENISNLFDFQAEDNIDNVSNIEKPAIIKRFWQYVRAKARTRLAQPS